MLAHPGMWRVAVREEMPVLRAGAGLPAARDRMLHASMCRAGRHHYAMQAPLLGRFTGSKMSQERRPAAALFSGAAMPGTRLRSTARRLHDCELRAVRRWDDTYLPGVRLSERSNWLWVLRAAARAGRRLHLWCTLMLRRSLYRGWGREPGAVHRRMCWGAAAALLQRRAAASGPYAHDRQQTSAMPTAATRSAVRRVRVLTRPGYRLLLRAAGPKLCRLRASMRSVRDYRTQRLLFSRSAVRSDHESAAAIDFQLAAARCGIGLAGQLERD